MIVVLFEPEIPPNTGNIARLCAAYHLPLHLVEPLGFSLESRYLKRAGLDYWPHVDLHVWSGWKEFLREHGERRLIMATTKGDALLPDFPFHDRDALVFGPETRGLPPAVLHASPFHVRIPTADMKNDGVRSLNLSTACGIMVYAALVSSGKIQDFSS